MSMKSGSTLKLILALAAAAALSGCMTTDGVLDDQAHGAAHASDNYPITLNQGPRVLDVNASSGSLSPVAAAEVQGYLAGLRRQARSPLQIAVASGQGNSARVAAEIASLAMNAGIPRQMIQVSTYAGPSNGPVRLSYASSRPTVAPCGNWPSDLSTGTYKNGGYENLGCAVQTNIAAMIDNPETINRPAATDMVDSAAQIRAINRMNNSVNTVTLPTNYDFVK